MGKEEESSWSAMPSDLLESITDHLSLQDYLVFSCVCRNWRFAPSRHSEIIHFRKNLPWLMFYGFDENDMDKCYLYSHSHPKCCTVRVPHLQGATCLASKSGWLLAKRNEHIFFCNPFSGTKIDLPDYPGAEEQIATFSFPPTSPKCAIFIISRWDFRTIQISSCRVGDMEWVDLVEIEVEQKHLGTMIFATYRCDFCGECGDKKYRDCIYILGSRMFINYGVSNNTRYWGWCTGISHPDLYDLRQKGEHGVSLFFYLKKLHSIDWLDKFGQDGISITTCPHQLTSGNYTDFPFYKYDVPKYNRATSSQKAVWIEPVFSRILPEEDRARIHLWKRNQKPIKKPT